MSYNKAQELRKWQTWKQKEEQLLKSLGVKEEIIKQLYEYDYQMFLLDRRIRSRQAVTIDTFFMKKPFYDSKEIKTIDDLLDEINNEILCDRLSKVDSKTLYILLLKVLGYSVTDICKILKINQGVVYNRIYRLKKKLKKL